MIKGGGMKGKGMKGGGMEERGLKGGGMEEVWRRYEGIKGCRN